MTREEAIDVLNKSIKAGSKVPWLTIVEAVELAIQALSVSLPEGLEEAAEEHAGLNFDRQMENKSFWNDVDTFKAGARWRDAQIPKLPDDVEEAAEKYTDKQLVFANEELANSGYRRSTKMEIHVFSGIDVEDAFKAGAEWMAGQGYTQKCRIKADYDSHGADYGTRYLYVRMPDDSPIGEEVIVQIRKK